MLYLYLAAFIISMISVIHVGLHNFKNIEPFFWAVSMVIPASLLGYILTMLATTVEGVSIGHDVAFIDYTLLASLIFAGIMKELKIKISNALKSVIYLSNFSIYILSILPFSRKWYYAAISVNEGDWGNVIKIKAGPLMVLHGMLLGLMVIALFAARIYKEFHNKQQINKVINSYFLIVGIGTVIYIIQTQFKLDYSFMPVIYATGLVYLSFSYRDKFVHDIDAIVTKLFEDKKDCGYVAFDTGHRLVAFNDFAAKLFPQLNEHPIDSAITEKDERLFSIFQTEQNKMAEGVQEPVFTEIQGTLYRLTAEYFYMIKHGTIAGIVFTIEDYTKQQVQDDFVTRYDDNLRNEVDKQIRKVKKKYLTIERNIVDIIENRDSITGGHVKRTGDTMQIVVNTMAEHRIENITYEHAETMRRAAILHDIGKIVVDSDILCKPNKLSDQEFDVIRSHTTKGGEIISKMFENTEEECIAEVAVNVAKYHHERYDGTGYPEGLRGDKIPLEARIMALVDAYDAMVSYRCYKDKMNFQEAEREIIRCMGTQFDPALKKAFILSRSKLENYYREIEE